MARVGTFNGGYAHVLITPYHITVTVIAPIATDSEFSDIHFRTHPKVPCFHLHLITVRLPP